MLKPQAIIISFLIIFNLLGCADTGTVRRARSVRDISEKEALDTMSAKPRFNARRRFTYLMAWNNIPIGRIIAEVGDIKNYRGRDVYPVTLVTESNKFLSRIYRVEDTYISYIDTRTMTSRRYEADRKEGSYRKHVIVEYDFDEMEAVYTNLTDGSVKRCPIEENVQDPLSAICYFMTLPVVPGEKISMTVNLNEKNYRLFGKIGNIDVVRLSRLGSFPAFKVRPYVELGSERVRKGKAWVYFAGDKRRYPLYGVVLIPFGRVTATLREVKDGSTPGVATPGVATPGVEQVEQERQRRG
ncbi:MAG: hypothetical protein DRP85_07720 [Candidatus Makaraimicrobium thalassicum]|nr:MAG: hypothetical protein DRP85_07720 [Candidatus Omnitrophota bacterium]